jgi:hypothetical protein
MATTESAHRFFSNPARTGRSESVSGGIKIRWTHTARIWMVDVAELLDLARRKSIRGFSPAERRRYSDLLGDL